MRHLRRDIHHLHLLPACVVRGRFVASLITADLLANVVLLLIRLSCGRRVVCIESLCSTFSKYMRLLASQRRLQLVVEVFLL